MGELIEHGKERVGVDVVFRGLAVGGGNGLVELVDVCAKGVAAGSECVEGVGDDPVCDVESRSEIAGVAGTVIELRQRHACPGLVADRARVEKERKGCGSNEGAAG